MVKNIDWTNLGFGYIKTDYRYVSNFKDGSWDKGILTEDEMIQLHECACVLQYAQTCFEGLKAYRTEDDRVVCFRPDMNAKRMSDTAKRLEMYLNGTISALPELEEKRLPFVTANYFNGFYSGISSSYLTRGY